MRLTLLHFNDLHGRFDQMPRLFTLIQRARAQAQAAGRSVLLLDGGDSSSREVWESNITQGRANLTLLEAMGVQASVVGNNEAGRWGREALAQMAAAVHFPLLAANLFDAADPARLAVPGLRPSVVLAFGEFRLGLVGVTVPQFFYPRLGYKTPGPLPIVRREIAQLKAAGARTILVLSHLGVIDDYRLAFSLREIDVIVGGHTHTALRTPARAGNALLVQAGSHGKYLGRLDLDLDEATGRVRAFSGGLMPCDGLTPPDPTISATLEFVREEAARLTPVSRRERGRR